MCVYSMIGDHFTDKWKPLNPLLPSQPPVSPDGIGTTSGGGLFANLVSKQEFEALKKEVVEMKELLKKAREYDEKTGQKDCQQEEKIALLRRVAEAVGINIDDVLPTAKP